MNQKYVVENIETGELWNGVDWLSPESSNDVHRWSWENVDNRDDAEMRRLLRSISPGPIQVMTVDEYFGSPSWQDFIRNSDEDQYGCDRRYSDDYYESQVRS